MTRAFEDLFGVPGAFAGIPMAGRTDRRILQDAASRAGVSLSDTHLSRFSRAYANCLRQSLTDTRSEQEVLPGVRPLLDLLAGRRKDVFLALLTGNSEIGAQLKLEHFDLWRYFSCGAYGDAVMDRNELFAVALERSAACGVGGVRAADVIVVGDTELDVRCAAAAGAISVAVATGPSDAASLRASGAHVVLNDLNEREKFLKLLGETST